MSGSRNLIGIVPTYALGSPEAWCADEPHCYAVMRDGAVLGYVYRQYVPQEKRQTWALRLDSRNWYDASFTTRKAAIATVLEMSARAKV